MVFAALLVADYISGYFSVLMQLICMLFCWRPMLKHHYLNFVFDSLISSCWESSNSLETNKSCIQSSTVTNQVATSGKLWRAEQGDVFKFIVWFRPTVQNPKDIKFTVAENTERQILTLEKIETLKV